MPEEKVKRCKKELFERLMWGRGGLFDLAVDDVLPMQQIKNQSPWNRRAKGES